MNGNWKVLQRIIDKEERIIIGLMSGTSLDGLDIAICAVRGHGLSTDLNIQHFHTVPYDDSFKTEVKAIFSKQMVDLQLVTLMNEKIGLLHADMILHSLNDWGIDHSEIDVIASHGQTIFHAPKSQHHIAGFPNATLQIGDGDHIAVKTGIVTISDFRQKHIAAGGEGAPLAVYGDYLYFSKEGEIRIMLNIGGIANITYLPGDADASRIFSTDIGPGNTIMDQYIQAHFEGMHYDKDGIIAAAGQVNEALLNALLDQEFFGLPFPKTTGPEVFNLQFLSSAQLRSDTNHLSAEDVMATLNRLTTQVILDTIKSCINGIGVDDSYSKLTVYCSGGGIHNKLLFQQLQAALPTVRFTTTDELGILPDAKEAVLFALLANETLVGDPIDFGARSALPSVTMGKICLPF
jgi:anhydro-N-acetylmuramic acid kinase